MKGYDEEDLEFEKYGDGWYIPEDLLYGEPEPKRTWGSRSWHWWATCGLTAAIGVILWIA